MKLLADFLPVILFFVTFKIAHGDTQAAAAFANDHFGFLVSGGQVPADVAPTLLATVVVIAATLAQVLWLKARRKAVGGMLWASLAIVSVLGGATIWFHSETFIKWKPSVLYWTFGAALWLSRLVWKRNLLKLMMGSQIELPDSAWQRLNFAWIAFFGLMGLLNLWVAYSFATDVWVNFKLFGGIGLMMLFVVAQSLYMARYLTDTNDDGPVQADAPAANKAAERAGR
jgi:intracellular septation protein